MKSSIFIFLFFLSISIISSLSLSMSPPQLNLEGYEGELICEKVLLETEVEGTLLGQDRWAKEGFFGRDLLKHNLQNSDLNLKLLYPEEIKINGESEIDFCIEGKKGNYHGVLLYKIKEEPVQVGIWINATIKEKTNRFLSLTGNTISKNSQSPPFLITIILALIFLILIIFSKKKPSKSLNN